MDSSIGREESSTVIKPLLIIATVVVTGFLVLGGWYYFNDSGRPPIPTVPSGLRAKAESAAFPIVAQFEGQDGQRISEYGSCFSVAPTGVFITCAHVVTPPIEGATLVRLNLLMDGAEKPAKAVFTDEKTDTAVLHVDGYTGAGLSLAEQQPVKETTGFVFGYPTRFSGMAMPQLLGSGAIIEDIDHQHPVGGETSSVIKVRGTSNFGGSGGPVLNGDGEVIGMALAARFVDATSRQTSHVFVMPAGLIAQQVSQSQEVASLPPKVPPTNLDGDELVDTDDSTPFVADYPAVEIVVTDFRVGLRPRVTKSERATDLSVGQKELRQTRREQLERYEGMTTRSSVSSTRYSGGFTVRGTAAVGGASPTAGAISLGYSGSHRESTDERIQTQRTETTVSSNRLAQVTQRLNNLKESTKDTVFTPDSGYLQLTVNVRNTGYVACRLIDFSVNVIVEDQLWRTLSGAAGGDFKPKNLRPLQRDGDQFLMEFGGLNTADVEKILRNDEAVKIAFEVVPSSIELSGDDSVKRLDPIVEKCAFVEVEFDDARQQAFISAMQDGETAGVPLEELMQRMPRNDTPIEWSNGPFGDSLAGFFGKRGLPLLVPDGRTHGQWLAFHNGDELTGKWRYHEIQPGDVLSFRYMSPSEYWGDPDGWKGLVQAYAESKTLAGIENRFWTQLYAYNRSGKDAWDVNAQRSIREQARELAARYDQYFRSPTLPAAIRRRWPNATRDIDRFRTWFTGNEPQFAEIKVTLERMDAWWNVNDKLSPWFELKVEGKSKVESGAFDYDTGERSGSTKVNRGEFSWSPFQEVEFRLIDDGTVTNANLVHIRSQEFQSLESLLDDLAFDAKAIENLDPATSRTELMFRLEHDGQVIRQDEFSEYFASLLPRVVGVVPGELTPDLLAFDFWVDHRPVAYAHSAVVFEELHNAHGGQLDQIENLARAINARFRCYDFAKCVELAKKLPDVGDDEGKRVMPGMTLADVRELVNVANGLAKQDPESTSFLAFSRVLLHWQSYLRLDYLISRNELRRELGDDAVAEWTTRLKAQLTSDAESLDQIDGDSIRALAAKLIEAAHNGLEETPLSPKE